MIHRKCTGLVIDSFLLTQETQVIFMHYKKALTNSDRIITGTGFVTRTCMIHSLVDSSSFSNVRTNDYRNVSYDSLEENPLEVGLQFQLRIRPSPMVSSRRFLFTLN